MLANVLTKPKLGLVERFGQFTRFATDRQSFAEPFFDQISD